MILKKSFVLILVSLCYMALFCREANAENVLNRIDIDVLVHKDGSATVEETWNANVDRGSEFTKTFEHLNYASITEFTVNDETGKDYKYTKTWNDSASRLDKFTSNSYKAKMNGDTTLYWGLGNYGQRAYVLKYKVDNFISNSTDGQLSYFTFISPNNYLYPDTITMNISFENEMDVSNLEYKIYGLDADTEVIDNKTISIKSKQYKVDGSSYLVTLMKFNGNTFECGTNFNKSYADIVAECDAASGLNVQIKPVSFKEIIIVSVIIIAVLILLYYIITEIKIRKRTKNETGLSVSYLGAKVSKSVGDNIKEIYKDNNSLYEIYTIGYEYGIVQNLYSIVSAVILKWILEKYIEIEFIENTYDFKIHKKSIFNSSNDFEIKLFETIMKEDELNINSFEATIKENASFIKDWINNILLSESRLLNSNQLLETVELSKRLQKHMTFTEFKCTQALNKEAGKIQNLKEHIRKQNMVEVHNTLKLVYAQLFNITNSISNKTEDFEKLVIAMNRINQIITVRMESYSRASRTDKIDDLLDKVARELGI